MSLVVRAPITGRVLALADVPDEVFATGVVGQGLALLPHDDAEVLDVVAPCDGRLAKVHPHAVALEVGETGVIVHLGIDTVTLHGQGFDVLVGDGQDVRGGDVVIHWDTRAAREADLSVVTPVVVFEQRDYLVTPLVNLGQDVTAGQELFRVD